MVLQTEILERPSWLKIRLSSNVSAKSIHTMMRSKSLHTVCEEAQCPNLHECWALRRTATFMILGDLCTRACRFCAVKTGKPIGLDTDEPRRVAEAVQEMGLRHVVITAVARDDLVDGGAQIFVETVRAIRLGRPETTIEVLPSDMGGHYNNLKILMSSGPDILNHNIETVRRLSPKVRSKADYDRSLKFLRRGKEIRPEVVTKSSMMLGLGETWDEISEAMDDLRDNHVDVLTLGQYLTPHQGDKFYLKIEKYWHPDEFRELKAIALKKGFTHCESGPFVRSSYHADEQVPQKRIDVRK